MKPRFTLTALMIGVVLTASAAMALALKPTRRLADAQPPMVLVEIVPTGFGDWQLDTKTVPITVSPDVQARLDVLYNQTLNRTYINSQGQRMMLSIAYGGDQSGDGTQVHRPEFCYTAQGFQLTRNLVGELATRYGRLPVKRLLAVQGRRSEPITYWITVGDKATVPGVSRKLSQLAYGLTGRVPDGMLVRVSSIDADTQNAYRLQEEFINDMLAAMPPPDRVRVAGKFGA